VPVTENGFLKMLLYTGQSSGAKTLLEELPEKILIGLNPLLGYNLRLEAITIFENDRQLAEGIKACKTATAENDFAAKGDAAALTREVLSAFDNLEIKQVETIIRALPGGLDSLACIRRTAFLVAVRIRNYFRDREMTVSQLEDNNLYQNICVCESRGHLEDYLAEILAVYEKAVCDGSQSTLRRVCEYVKTRLGRKITLAEAAGSVFLSPAYLSRLFKEKMGINFIDYCTRIRMEYASRMLVNSSYKTYEVADMVGYDNPKNFTRAFKQFYNITPREMREKGKPSNEA
jgi:AraC-like DNA-binding protein